MFKREAEDYIRLLSTKFPVVTVTGPRQSGKTTLVKALFKDKPYVNLENISQREFAQNDPQAFLALYKDGAIIDEVQNVPELFSYIQVRVDERDIPGEFILSGSQNFLMMEKITQSLAGRVGIVQLLPLSLYELNEHPDDPYDLIVKGFYPRIHKMNIDPTMFYEGYLQTYVERDLRQIQNIMDLKVFQTFIKLCAARIGQLLNLSSLATECGISQNTAKKWISVLETSYILFTLQPYYKNFNKRLVKQSKIYFYDTGLACFLLGIDKVIYTHHMKGALFENFVILELIKQRWNQGKKHNLYFWRDNHGHEVDVLFEKGEKIVPIEIKATQTMHYEFFKGLEFFTEFSQSEPGYVIYGGAENMPKNTLSWKNMREIKELK